MEKEIVIGVQCGRCDVGNVLVTIRIVTDNSQIIAYAKHDQEFCVMCSRLALVMNVSETPTEGGLFL